MNELFLDGYSGQTTAELISMADRYRIDSLVLAFEQAVDAKAFERGAGNLTEVERTIVAIEALEREVNNGGYSQFFSNSSNEYAGWVVTALERIGCRQTAQTTKRAIDALRAADLSVESIGSAIDRDDAARDAILEACDTAYFQGTEAIADLLFEYIRANQAQVRLP